MRVTIIEFVASSRTRRGQHVHVVRLAVPRAADQQAAAAVRPAAKPQLREAVARRRGVVDRRSSGSPSGERTGARRAASAAPSAAGTAEAVNRDGRVDAQYWTPSRSAMKPPAGASDSKNVPIRRSTRSSTRAAPRRRAPRWPSTWTVGLVDDQRRAVRAEQIAVPVVAGRRRLHRADCADDDASTPPSVWARSSIFSSLLQPMWRKGPELGAREETAVKNQA